MNPGFDFLSSIKSYISYKIEQIDGVNYYTIVNPKHCQIFWVKYFHDIFSKNFKQQQVIQDISQVNLTRKVFLDANGNLAFPDEVIESITKYALLNSIDLKTALGPMSLNISGLIVFLLSIVAILFALYLEPILNLTRLV